MRSNNISANCKSKSKSKSPKNDSSIKRTSIINKTSRQSSSGNNIKTQIQTYINSKKCQICQTPEREEELLLCDRCDDSYHIFCLTPKLDILPERDWICPICIKQLDVVAKIKRQKMAIPKQTVCFKCHSTLSKIQTITEKNLKEIEQQVQCKSLVNLTCLYCSHTFHNNCFSERKNSLNCWECECKIRKNGPKNHEQFMQFINQSLEQNKYSDFNILENLQQDETVGRYRHFALRVPTYMTFWQFIVQNEASLYYAFKTKGLHFIDQQIYAKKDKFLMSFNNPKRDTQGKIYKLHEKDEKAYQQFKKNSNKGYVGPFQVKQDRIKGFYLVSTDYIEPFTIVSEYIGEVMTSRNALNQQQNDSIFLLVRSSRADQSLDIVPQKYGNIARFFSGINNQRKRILGQKRLQNIRALRFSYKGRVRLLLHTIRPIQAGETLYFDYNGSAFHEYPTEHFIP